MTKRVIRLAARAARLDRDYGQGSPSSLYVTYSDGGVTSVRGPWPASSAGRLAAARAFLSAPGDGSRLWIGDLWVA